jgi:hypothetical protein
MTHKNPALRASSTVPSSVGTSAGAHLAFGSLNVIVNELGLVVSPKEAG